MDPYTLDIPIFLFLMKDGAVEWLATGEVPDMSGVQSTVRKVVWFLDLEDRQGDPYTGPEINPYIINS